MMRIHTPLPCRAFRRPHHALRARALGWVFITVAASVTPCIAQSIDEPVCSDTTIAGQVSHGDRFESDLANGLRFVLDPSIGPPNPDGWIIRVVAERPDQDFLMIATPPYRFGNPRYLDTSYGNTAEQAVAWRKRPFNFVLSEEDFARMHDAIGVLLWPADHDSTRIAEAWATTESVTKARGTLRILESETSPPSEEVPLGRIEKIVFEVDLCRTEEKRETRNEKR